MERLDVVIIGAGWFGLAAAKTYIELHPFDNVVVLEAASTLGGVWAKNRLYPGLKSNNMLGTYEYPDFPMDGQMYGVNPGEHIPGPVIHQYLTDYALKFGIYERISFNTQVDAATPDESNGWILTLSGKELRIINTRKLIMATGLTSRPYVPNLPGMQNFQAPLFHPRDFPSYQNTLGDAKTAVVLGGGKSAWDAAYAYARAGVQVHMIIRKSGHGPAWMAPPYVTPFKRWLEKLVHTRVLTWFSPCVWGDEDGYRKARSFLHGTALGRTVTNSFWNVLARDVITLNQYDSHPELKKLKPWDSAFYVGSGLSIHNYPTSFFDMVREGRIRVHIDEIEKLAGTQVRLVSGETIDTDVFVSATGWTKESSVHFPVGVEDKIGLQYPPSRLETMARTADTAILQRFPRLKTQPDRRNELENTTAPTAERPHGPLRFYRFMVPPSMVSQRNIAFSGMCSTISTSMVANAQALWISAFFDNKLDRLPVSTSEIEWQTVLHSQFGKWRCPVGNGPRFPDFVFDAMPYLDMLLRDLNLKHLRKGGFLREIATSYGPEDYTGLAREWQEQRGKV